jgi:hypothetical protein
MRAREQLEETFEQARERAQWTAAELRHQAWHAANRAEADAEDAEADVAFSIRAVEAELARRTPVP